MEKNNFKLKQLQNLITYLIKKDNNKKWRKVTETDIFGKIDNLSINKFNVVKKKDKVLKFRMQEEFGQKKRIKPWRTGTKSQQQIVPKGHKKGFRGKTLSTKK